MTKILNAVILFVLLCCAVLFGCDNTKLTPIPEHGVILAFGDSLTVGVGADSFHSYPSVLTQLSGCNVINAGISGEVTAQGRRRFASVLDEHDPQLVILLEGGNDMLRNRNLASVKDNLAWMIETAQGQGVEVVLLGVPSKNLFVGVPALYGELATTYALVYDEELVFDLLRTPGYKSDVIHLNAQGYRAMAEAVHALLDEHDAL